MINAKEGAAIRQDTRANAQPAKRRKTRRILPELREPEEWGRAETIIAIAIGGAFLYAFMWLAAAY